MSQRHRSLAGPLKAIVLLALAAPPVGAQADLGLLRVASSRPDAVTGDDVLVQLTPPQGSSWNVLLNGHDVSTSFRPTESGALLALLTGLRLGANSLRVRTAGEVHSETELVNHPLSGPIFSGPHQEPFLCQTEQSGLGPALDADCRAPTRVQYYYKSTEASTADTSAAAITGFSRGFKTYDPSKPAPNDIAQTTTSGGRRVPYIVRREIGVINRAVYDIEILYQPGQTLPSPWSKSNSAWNGRLILGFGGDGGAGYRQGSLGANVGISQETYLALGYALAGATLGGFRYINNDRIVAETLSMVKEHFIKEFGVPVHTIGVGGSGSAMDEYLTVQNYPGVIDGLIAYIAFPDEVTTVLSITDCTLLDHAFEGSGSSWSEAQKTAVSGFASWKTCADGWGDAEGLIWPIQHPQQNCWDTLPKAAIYDPRANAQGARCDFYSGEINVFGKSPSTGHAYRPLDNAGVQYGLVAFNRGQIDAERFVELNERIGGFDDDGAIVTVRTVAPPKALLNTYERGIVLSGGGATGEVPMIDWRQYGDDLANQHDSFRSYANRERLRRANGHADNQVILIYPRWSPSDMVRFTKIGSFEVIYRDLWQHLIRRMDQWLDAIDADRSQDSQAIKVVRDKPQDLADGCWAVDGERIVEALSHDGTGRCNRLYPSYGDPRIAAGGPLTDDVLKCALKPFDPSDYRQPPTADQIERLRKIFLLGVCDYTKPGVGQVHVKGTWQVF